MSLLLGSVFKFLPQKPGWTPGFSCLTQHLRRNTLEAHLLTVWSDTICLLAGGKATGSNFRRLNQAI